MSLRTKHPLYSAMETVWELCRDNYLGEDRIKDQGVKYLPPTASMELDGMKTGEIGHKRYEAMKLRAAFHEYFKAGVETHIGYLHQKPADIKLPAQLEYLRTRATANGEPLIALLRRINEEQLITGRVGIMLDLPAGESTIAEPYIALYTAEAILNWDESDDKEDYNSLNLVVLNESGFVRGDDFTWKIKDKYRVLQYGDITENEKILSSVYSFGIFDDAKYNSANMQVAKLTGKPCEEIPFVFINSKDAIPEPDQPPLLSLARMSMSIYRSEADYRENLHMQGQDTLVTIGGVRNPNGLPGEDDAIRTGTGSRIDVELGGDAKYIGVTSTGLAEQRQALEADKNRAEFKSGNAIDSSNSKQESGKALGIRLGAQTATLNQIAYAGAGGLEKLIKILAVWKGANPDEVVINPNVEFTDVELGGQEIVYLMTGRSMGAPLSKESIHDLMVARGYTKFDYDTELEKIAKENEAAGLNADGSDPNADPDANQPASNTPASSE